MWKIKITDPMMKLKTNSNSIKGLRIKIKNQKIEGSNLKYHQILNWKEKSNSQKNPKQKSKSREWGSN